MKLWTEIEQATFTLAVRGYDRTEVDEFIDGVAITVRDIEDKNSALYAKVKVLESELTSRRQNSSSVEHAFLEAVEKKQLMLADAERRAHDILAQAESHAASSPSAQEAEALRAQASLILEQASGMLSDAERESAMIRSKAAADGESAFAAIKGEADRMLRAAQAEAAAIVAGAEQQHDRLAAALRLLQDAVAEMLSSGAEQHEVIKVVLGETEELDTQHNRGVAIA